MASPFDQQASIDGIQNVFVIASGKGGVGKSTVTSNLALALCQQGKKIGLLDCDIYGPSIPRMLGLLNQKPTVSKDNRLIPLEKYNMKVMSIGFMVAETSAVVWRGPMLFKAIDQFLKDVQWGLLDALIIDLPPGTGDVQLTLAQRIPITGAVVVTTPQNVALADVIKSIDMFKTVKVPVIGVVENMSYFRSEQGRMELFPKGDLQSYLTQNNIPLLAQVPFHTSVAMGGEAGLPVVQTHPQSIESQAFFQIAQSIGSLISLKVN